MGEYGLFLRISFAEEGGSSRYTRGEDSTLSRVLKLTNDIPVGNFSIVIMILMDFTTL